jgi:A/G-specific adenine glycosylase
MNNLGVLQHRYGIHADKLLKNNQLETNNITDFRNHILKWYFNNGRVFPWREAGVSEYRLVLTEILLQRTKAENVAKFYELFFDRFPDWQSLGSTTLEEIGNVLRPLGLHQQRAKRLFDLAKYMVSNNEQLPNNRSELDKIPFMGQYIANAVQLLLFDVSKPLLDSSMARVLERYFGPRRKVDIRYDDYLQELSHEVVRGQNSKIISWAILDFAALICQSRRPKCPTCFLTDNCTFYNRNINSYL